MQNMSKIIHYVAIPAFCLGLVGSANAADPERGYVLDNQGVVVKSGFGDCVRSASPGSKIPTACGGEVKAEVKPARIERAAQPPVVTKTTLEAKALFAVNKYALKPAGRASLDKLAREIKSTPGVQEVHVIGHTDSTGSNAYNQSLSERRATSVKSYLQSKGVSSITAEGRGENEPVASNNTETGRSQNRRVEVEVVTP